MANSVPTNTSLNVNSKEVMTYDADHNITLRPNKSLTIELEDGTKYDLVEFMQTMSQRFLILQPNFEAHEKYPALKEAYEHYLTIEALVCGNKRFGK